MRNWIWKIAVKNHPEGMILPVRLQVFRAILYPMDAIYWHMSKSRGYQWETDVWHINGMKFTGAALRLLAEAQGETYTITKTNDCVTMRRVDA